MIKIHGALKILHNAVVKAVQCSKQVDLFIYLRWLIFDAQYIWRFCYSGNLVIFIRLLSMVLFQKNRFFDNRCHHLLIRCSISMTYTSFERSIH